MNIRQIIKEEVLLYEKSMKRALNHISKESGIKSWGMITAFRDEFTKKENLARNKKLASDIRGLGYGFFRLDGLWQECQDNTVVYKDCPKSELVAVNEITFFIPKIKKNELAKLTAKYDQDASIYSGKEVDDKIAFITRSGKANPFATKATPGVISQAYSKLKGKTFVFEYNI